MICSIGVGPHPGLTTSERMIGVVPSGADLAASAVRYTFSRFVTAELTRS